MKTRLFTASLVALSLSISAQAAAAADAPEPGGQAAAPAGSTLEPAPLSELINSVSIPYERFTLDNGLTVLVHTDRKAPVVAISVYYGVGSKHEPKGKTGFAHLFEHLMFNGSENWPGDIFVPLQQMGATDYNGTTWFDRTNYFQTVPTGALDRMLMLESDRMGYLLGAVTQEKLNNQIGVVQNEKRQRDNQPFGKVEYEQLENLYPVGHPYHHAGIGSMEDLSSATLDDVKNWFRDHYGPNNAILVLAGDIDLATARAKVGKWFGAIPAGPEIRAVEAPVPTLPAPVTKTMFDQVPTTRLYRMWAVPGIDQAEEAIPLSVSSLILGGLASSRLDQTLVREQEIAVGVAAFAAIFAQAGQFVVFADVKPGVDLATASAALDAQIRDFIKQGPSADEVLRASTVYAAGAIRQFESVGGFSGKAPTLAEGLLYSNDPSFYKTSLNYAASLTPERIRDVASRWLSRPAFSLVVQPQGQQQAGGNAPAQPAGAEGAAIGGPAWYSAPGSVPLGATAVAAADRSKLPDIEPTKALDFPAIERATLSNGIKVQFARRAEIPALMVRLTFDAGYSADPKDALGIQSLMLQMMNEGTDELDATQLAIAQERLGAGIYAFASSDQTSFHLNALTPNFAASVKLLSDFVRKPAFSPKVLERVRAQQLTRLNGELSDPGGMAERTLLPLLYGPEHPYGIPPSGLGDPAAIARLSAEDLRSFHKAALQPGNATITVVGDSTLAEVTSTLEQAFGNWQAGETNSLAKDFSVPIPPAHARIVLVDRPNSPQSMILAGRVIDRKGTDDLVLLGAANEVLGGSFISRINMNLRETKGWSYGAYSTLRAPQGPASFIVSAPVQADRTGESIAELRAEIARFLSGQGVTGEELERTVTGNIRELPGRFETAGDVLGGVLDITTYRRADNHFESLADRYAAMQAAQLDSEARRYLAADDLVWVVVGDAAVVKPQLETLGLPLEVLRSPAQ